MKKQNLLLPVFAGFALSLSGCSSKDMGDAELGGVETVEPLFNNAAERGAHLTIEGSNLSPDTNYKYTGSVTVNGDIPSGVNIDVRGGKLKVNGDVHENVELDVSLPVNTKRERYSCARYNAALKMTTMQTCTRTVATGLSYHWDHDPAIDVNGSVGDGVELDANAGIEVSGAIGQNVTQRTGWGRPFLRK